jgi:class 3 adenylate cyclase
MTDMELRLFLEDLACNICRFVHTAQDNVPPQLVNISQEVQVGRSSAFADIVVRAPGTAPYIVEVDYGYSRERISESLSRKYKHPTAEAWLDEISRLILVCDAAAAADIDALTGDVRNVIPPHWDLELWDDRRIQDFLRVYFGVDVLSLDPGSLQDVRAAVDRSQGQYAFGEAYDNSPMDSALLWHFGYWRLQEIFMHAGAVKRSVLPPGSYGNVVAIYADLSGFSGYVRDTPDQETIRECLTAFCAKSRYQIINDGGMLYQFLGDAVIALFGIPERTESYVDKAYDCARSLLAIGESVSHEWQRRLDRLQPVHGSHVGIAVGNLQFHSLRPFSRTHMGAVGDVINMAARLSTAAAPGSIALSNLVYRAMSRDRQRQLDEMEPIEAKNVGRIKAWCYRQI